MHLKSQDKARISGSFTVVREPDRQDVAAQSDPKVIATVSEMLSTIERGGIEEVRRYAEKLDGYRALAEDYFDIDSYREFCAEHLAHLDEVTLEFVESQAFDDLLVSTVQRTFPEHEHEHFVAHYRGLLGMWVTDQHATVAG